MPFIEMDMTDVKEAKPAPIGRYDMQIVEALDTLTKGGDGKEQKPQIKVTLMIEGHDEAPPVYHYLQTPSPSDKDGGKFQALQFARFLAAFKIPVDPRGIDTAKVAEDLVGKRANLELTQQEYNGNTSNQLVIPKLKDESTAGAGRGSPPKQKKA